jgi:hypothetical protein
MVLGTKTKFFGLLLTVAVLSVVSLVLFNQSRAYAATGINQTIEFQGRLLNAQGAIVPDGYYNVEFKIYENGNGQSVGDTTGSPAGTLLWTEDYLNYNNQGVEVVNGFFSVQLGSITPFGTSIDWNQSTLWLSMNIAGTSTTCSTFSACNPDGEMIPMQPLTSSPYAFNAGQLNGMSSSQFVQLGQGVQTDASTNASIFINKTGSGDLAELQSAGTDALILANNGDITFGNNTTTHNLSVETAAASSAGVSINIIAGAAGSGSSALAGGNLNLSGGSGGGTNGNGGNVVIDAGQANGTGTNGSVDIGTQYANSVAIGNTTGTSGVSISVGTGNFALNGVGASTYSIGTVTTTGTITVGSTSQTGVLVLQGEGIKNTINGSATSPSDIIQTSNNTSAALAVENSSNDQVVSVDTSANQVVLGQASTINGSLGFKNNTNANTITLDSTVANANYTLTLPSSAPNPGLCIETSSSSASQLVFASCSNTNASITEVAEWDANATNSLTISPSAVGDEIILTTQIPTSGVTVSSISGGGVSSWTKAVVSNGNGTVNRVEMWIGTVTATGSSTITVTYSGSPGSEEITATEFTAAGVNASTTWGLDSTGSQINSASTVVTFPNLNSISSDELYFGYGQVQNPPATAGTTSGFNYIITSIQHNVITYDDSTNANTAYQPTANQNSSGESNVVGAVLTAFVTSTAINNSTSVQQANFYVQAANSGSIAGILQAAGSGNADIFDARNSNGTNVATIGYNGIATFESSTNQAGAFTVNNDTNKTVLSVNTSTNQVALGSANNIAGDINFYDSSDTNAIGLSAPSSIAASYTLTLPSNTPTAGLCLGTSPSNANQLIFTSCATQVSAGSIAYVGEWDTSGSDVTSLTISPTNVGDLLIFYSHETNNVSVSSVSGGGVNTWTKITSGANGSNGGSIEMWRGVVTTTGSSSVSVSYSSNPGTNEIAIEEFTMHSANSTWAIDNSGVNYNTTTSTTINYPDLTPTNSSELYTGYAWSQYSATAGTTTGYTYISTTAGHLLAYDASVTGGTPTYPSATQSTAGYYNTIAADIAGYTGTSVIVNSTSTQEANFNVQAATSGSVAGVLQAASSGTADILDLRNSNGNNIVAVNSNNGLILGTSNIVGGQLVFNDSGNSNAITIAAPTNIGASYSLTLPSTNPAPGECLASSPSNANQLVFSSCANQVTSVAISYVNSWTSSGNGNTLTLNVSPANVGDIMILFVTPQKSNNVSSVSGGGVSAWSQITSTISGSGIAMWRGQITASGASTITVNLSGANGTNELDAYEFTTGSTTGSWVIDASGTLYNSTSSTTITYPSLTPQSTKDLYIGEAAGTSTTSAGTTTGFTYKAGALTTRIGAYNNSISSQVQPTASQSNSGTSVTAAALIAAYSSSSVIANSTVTQSANFNVQAATSGSVAGVLQAYGGGTGDIFDALNGTGTLVDSIGYSGNLLVIPSSSSVAAMEVQTPLGTNVLSVDTSNLRVNIGAGSAGENTPSILVLDNETGTSADPAEVDGGMYYNATTRSFRCGVAGAWETCNGLLYSNSSASSADSNCTNNCAAFSTAAAVPANYCQTGRVIKILGDGYYSTDSNGDSLQFGVYYGSSATSASSDTLIGTLTPSTSTISASNYYFQINYNIICYSTSSISGEGTLSIQTTGSNTTSLAVLPIASTSTTTVVTNIANNLYIFPIWGTAGTSDTATLTQMIVNGY